MDDKFADVGEGFQVKNGVAKKTYSPPVLRVYGAVHQFTQGSAGMASDGAAGMTMM